MTWLGIKPKQSLSCRYHTELIWMTDKANIAKGIYWMHKTTYSFFSQAGETFERPNTRNKFHDSETEGVQISQISQFKIVLESWNAPWRSWRSLRRAQRCQSHPSALGELLGWKVLCHAHRRWSRQAAMARNREENFGNIVGKRFEKGQLDSEQTDRERTIMARECPWWHWTTLGKKSCWGTGSGLGYCTSPIGFVQLCFRKCSVVYRPFDLCSRGCKDYQDFVQLTKNLKAGGIMDVRMAISTLQFW